MIIKVSAGHNPDGKVACGAVGLKKESTEARKITKYVVKYLKKAGFKAYNCTVNNGTSQKDVLNKIIAKHNSSHSDLDVSIHLNIGAKDLKGDGKTTGVEVFVLNVAKEPTKIADNVCKEIATLGFKNRGVKPNSNLAFINSTNAPSMLVEVCFLDDADDMKIYNYKKVARAITRGIVGSYLPHKYTTTTKVSMFNDNFKKVGSLGKNHVCTITDVDVINGYVVGRLKKAGYWIKLKYAKRK